MSVTEKIADYRQDSAKILISCEKSRVPDLQSCIWAGSLFRHIMATSMRSRFQIILPNRQLPGTPVQASGFWNRIKRFWAGVALATVAVAVLVAALILGSVIAVVLAIMLMIGIAVIVAKVALVRSKRTKA